MDAHSSKDPQEVSYSRYGLQAVEVGDSHQSPVSAQGVLKLHGVEPVPVGEGGHAVDAAGESLVGLRVGAQRGQRVEGGQRLEAVSGVVLL